MRRTRILALLAAGALVLAACGSDDGGDSPTTTAGGDSPATTSGSTDDMDMDELTGLPVIDPFDVPEGDVAIAGSSTVFPLSTALMSLWEDEGGPGYSIDSIGSGGGFERF